MYNRTRSLFLPFSFVLVILLMSFREYWMLFKRGVEHCDPGFESYSISWISRDTTTIALISATENCHGKSYM